MKRRLSHQPVVRSHRRLIACPKTLALVRTGLLVRRQGCGAHATPAAACCRPPPPAAATACHLCRQAGYHQAQPLPRTALHRPQASLRLQQLQLGLPLHTSLDCCGGMGSTWVPLRHATKQSVGSWVAPGLLDVGA